MVNRQDQIAEAANAFKELSDDATADEIAERALPALKSQFTPLEVSAEVFSWDPV